MSTWSTLGTTLFGALVGGGSSIGTSWWTQRPQRKATLDSERRTRERATTARVGDAFSKLLLMEAQPDEPSPTAPGETPDRAAIHEWERHRDELLLIAQVAALDVPDESLQKRLEEDRELIKMSHAAEMFGWS